MQHAVLQEHICHVTAWLPDSRFRAVWLQSHFMYVEPEGDISLFFTWAEAHARASSDSHLRQGAIRLDSMLASWFQQRLRPHALFNTCFGSGPDASLWQHGALPLWLLKIFMSEMFVFKVSEALS